HFNRYDCRKKALHLHLINNMYLMKMKYIFTVLSVMLLSQFAFGQKKENSNRVMLDNSVANGVASYYHDKFVGRPTSTGETFSNDKYTAASNTISLNTYVKV